MTATLPDGAAQVFAEVTRVSVLDADGYVPVGSPVLVTNTLMKATFTPVKETGVDLVTLTANADIGSHFKHGDMPKYDTCAIELVTPDPTFEALLCGGTIFTDNSAALGLPTGLACTAQTGGGTLAAGTYGYRASQYNRNGSSAAEAEVTATTTGSTGAVFVHGVTLAAGALGWEVFGRLPGGEEFMGLVPNIGSQATSAASGTGTVTSLTVTALTAPIPAGTQFQITGDTNTVPITFTTTQGAGIGATVLFVTTTPASITTTITAAAIIPGLLDTGAIVPNGHCPTVDTTAGPGVVGYQDPALAIVGNPYGVGLEFWGKAILNGTQAGALPYNRWAIPGVKNMMRDAANFEPALLANAFTGQAFENPNWGTGPLGDWPYDSSKTKQRFRTSRQSLPVPSLTTTQAIY